jgi:hypothetical protein
MYHCPDHQLGQKKTRRSALREVVRQIHDFSQIRDDTELCGITTQGRRELALPTGQLEINHHLIKYILLTISTT